MTIRTQLKMQWHISMGDSGPFSKIEDFEMHARNVLEKGFSNYDAKLAFEVSEDYGPQLNIVSLTWDVNLDGVMGGYYQPTDHETYAKTYLVKMMRMWSSRLNVEILRHTDKSDDTSHTLVAWDHEYREQRFQKLLARHAAEDAAAA